MFTPDDIKKVQNKRAKNIASKNYVDKNIKKSILSIGSILRVVSGTIIATPIILGILFVVINN